MRNPVSGFLALTAVEDKVRLKVLEDCLRVKSERFEIKSCQGELVESDAICNKLSLD